MFCVSVFSQEAIKVDEFETITCEDYLARMDNFMIQSQNDPNMTPYIIIYEGKEWKYDYKKDERKLLLPTVGLAKAKIRSMKQYMTMKGVSPKRFMFIEGGFKEKFTVEMWFIPLGAEAPKPAPTLTKMKYRKGRSSGYCVGCC